MLISRCVEDISRYAAGDMDLQHTTETLINDMDRTETLGIRSLIESLNRLAKKWEKDGKRLWLYSASGVLTVMMHGDREDNPIPEMLPNAGTNPDNIITTISGIGNDGGDWLTNYNL